MNQTARLHRIDDLLRSRGVVPRQVLLDELEVSPATLKRDLAMLRDRFNAPIEYDASVGGYRLATAGAGPAYALPGLWFNDREVLALLTMHRMLEDLDTGGLLGPHVQPLIERLNRLLEKPQQASAAVVRERVRIVAAHNRPVPPAAFEAIGSALIQRRRLEIDYFTRTRNAHGSREVSPQRLVHYRNAWYLDAWCHRAQALRVFALDAIARARPLAAAAQEIVLGEVDAQVGGAYGIFRGAALSWAVLRFSSDAARWVRAEVWHPQQRARELEDGRYELTVPYSGSAELEMDILRHGEQVEVVAPVALRERVAERLRRAAARYAAASVEPAAGQETVA